MIPRAVHQFTPSVAYGDGVTGGIFFTQTLLRRFGFTSEIYAHHIDPRLANEVHPLSTYLPSADQTLLFHHSIGHEHDTLILSWPDSLILVYHNITPEHFFADSPHLAAACTWGRDQLKRWPRNRFLGAYADSNYNRDELIRLGYHDVRTIPLLVDLSRFDTPSPSVFRPPEGDPFTILFVGRMVENKCQDQLIDVLDELILAKLTNIRLVLVGGISSLPYKDTLESKMTALGLRDWVLLAGKVSDEELRRWYVTADLYLSLSEHEGFGMPLLEAMAHDLPVLAYDAGALSTTLPASSLLSCKAPGRIAGEIMEIMDNPARRRDMIVSQRDHLHRFHPLSLAKELADFLKQCDITVPRPPFSQSRSSGEHKHPIRIDGPCDSTYSLALVNRELGRALMEQGRELSFFATEGPGDYSPNREFLASDPQILESLSDYPLHSQTVIRNLYPPRVSGMGGVTKILGPYGWEESAFLHEYVQNFNRRLSGIACMSTYVAKVMRDNGVTVPLAVTGIGADHILKFPPKPLGFNLPAGIKLLHVSSCFPRKGVDLLLLALERLEKPLSLIVKTFPNPHNTLRTDLLNEGWSFLPPNRYVRADKTVLLIEDDLSMGQMRTLYGSCDCLVAPSRGEGFGLPMAEAMLLNLPVITTAYGGQSDFCTPDTAWLIDFTFAPARTHMNLSDSVWVEPDVDDLVRQIVATLESTIQARKVKTDAARTLIESQFTWKAVAQKMSDFIHTLEAFAPSPFKIKNVAFITTYNTKCGIAEYSRHLIEPMRHKPMVFAPYAQPLRPDAHNVIRCWSADDLSGLSAAITAHAVDTLMIQFNYSLFRFDLLCAFIEEQVEAGRTVFITLHATIDDLPADKKLSLLISALHRCRTVFVHTVPDLNRLKWVGLIGNVTLFPHGVVDYPFERNRTRNTTFTLATYGFFLPHKGLIETIHAVAVLREKGMDIHLYMVNALYPAPISQQLIAQARDVISKRGLESIVTLHTEFLPEHAALLLLEKADLILFPYQNTTESSSAAVRYGLASGTPVAVTPLPIFDDVREAVFTLPGISFEEIAIGIVELYQTRDAPARHITAKNADRWRKAHSYQAISRSLESLLEN